MSVTARHKAQDGEGFGLAGRKTAMSGVRLGRLPGGGLDGSRASRTVRVCGGIATRSSNASVNRAVREGTLAGIGGSVRGKRQSRVDSRELTVEDKEPKVFARLWSSEIIPSPAKVKEEFLS